MSPNHLILISYSSLLILGVWITVTAFIFGVRLENLRQKNRKDVFLKFDPAKTGDYAVEIKDLAVKIFDQIGDGHASPFYEFDPTGAMKLDGRFTYEDLVLLTDFLEAGRWYSLAKAFGQPCVSCEKPTTEVKNFLLCKGLPWHLTCHYSIHHYEKDGLDRPCEVVTA